MGSMGDNECQTCRKTFSQKSSLVRHRKLCSRAKHASPRQKSCQRCSGAKAKCDLQRPTCSRCIARGVSCVYTPTAPSTLASHHGPSPSDEIAIPQTATSAQFQDSQVASTLDVSLDHDDLLFNIPEETSRAYESITRLPEVLSFPESTTSSPEETGLRYQWMLSLLPPTDPTPILVRHSMEVLLRVLQTWPRMIAKGFQLPPVFHASIMTRTEVPLPLANCCTLVKMWDGQFNGTSAIVEDTITKEVNTIFANFQMYDETEALAALQAVLVYSIMLVFPSRNQNAIPLLDPSIFAKIRQIVYQTASSGMVLQEETEHDVPSWEAWIHITSKRRVVFTLYMLHWSYSVYHRLQSFNCEELGYMPAPAPKFLWNATSREQWEGLYKRWLTQWDGREYMQYEFDHVRPGVILDRRTEMWLEDADELGILFSSIFGATDREPQFRSSSYTGTPV